MASVPTGDSPRTVDAAEPARAGERLVRVGGLIAAVGAVATLVALLPLVVRSFEPPSWLWFVAIGGVGVGVGLSLWGMVRAARARSRYVRDAP